MGSGAVIATLSPTNGVGSDAFKPLIGIFQTLKADPELLIEYYSENYMLIEEYGKERAYEIVKTLIMKIQIVRTCYFYLVLAMVV